MWSVLFFGVFFVIISLCNSVEFGLFECSFFVFIFSGGLDCIFEIWCWVCGALVCVDGNCLWDIVFVIGIEGWFFFWDSNVWVLILVFIECILLLVWVWSECEVWVIDLDGGAWYYNGVEWKMDLFVVKFRSIMGSADLFWVLLDIGFFWWVENVWEFVADDYFYCMF